MKIRPLVGSYEQAMSQVKEIDGTANTLKEELGLIEVRCDFYLHDKRNGWGDTYLVMGIDSLGGEWLPRAFTDGGISE